MRQTAKRTLCFVVLLPAAATGPPLVGKLKEILK
jgi:hypothetical protein